MQGYPPGGGYPAPQGQALVHDPHAQHQVQAAGWGRLEVHTSFNFLLWILFFVSTGIEINGQKNDRPWGDSFFDLPAGTYHLRIYFNYLLGPSGISQTQVTIHPGYSTKLSYRAPWLVFLSGTLREEAPAPVAQLPPAHV